MKTAGIVAAMDAEIDRIKSGMEISMTKNAVGADYYIGSIAGKKAVLVKCGVGKVNAAVRTQALIDLFDVDCVINTGVAGAIFHDAKIGDLVISSDVAQHDFDCTSLGYKKGQIPWQKESFFNADAELIKAAEKAAAHVSEQTGVSVYTARIASGDTFVASKDKKREIWESFSAYCVEMEGAAIAQACALNKIPFVVLRSISDGANDEGGADFNAFVIKAASISQEITEKIIEYI